MTESTPVITFTADRTLIRPGEPVTIRWHVEGVREVYFFVDGEDWRGHGVAGVAERQLRPTQTTAYRLRVVRLDGLVDTRGLDINVQDHQARSPFTRVFAVDKTEIQPGECITFRWHAEGVKAVYFHADSQPWHEHGVAGVADQQMCPGATTTYCLRVVKADDSLEVHYITVAVVTAR